MSWTFPNNEIPINARITFAGAWNDVDLGANNDVPPGTKGVVLHVRNTGSSNYFSAVRYNGTADNRAVVCPTGCHGWFVIGLDANRVFEGYFSNSALDVRICAFTSDDRFYPTSTEFANTGNNAYEDITLSQEGAKAAWLEISGSSADINFAIRKKGNIFESYKYLGANRTARAFTCFAGLNDDLKAEHKTDSYTVTKHYLWGWCGDEIVALDTPVKKQADQASAWRDIDCSANVPAGALGVILQVVNAGASVRAVNVRKKDSTDNNTTSINLGIAAQTFAVVGLNSSRIFQAYTTNITDIEMWVVGYVLPAQFISGAGNIAGAEAFGTSAVTPGAVSVTAAGNVGSAEAGGTPQVVPGAVTLFPAGLPSAVVFGTAQIIPGRVTLAAISILSGETLGTPEVIPAGAVFLYPPGIQHGENCGVPVLMQPQSGNLPGKLALNLDMRRLGAAPRARRLAAAPQITRWQVTPDA